MDEAKKKQKATLWPVTLTADLRQPIILERGGKPVAVLMSFEDYEHYQVLLAQREHISALEARRAADRAVFGDLVGCALSSEEPVWAPAPTSHWRIPYRFFDGALLTIVEVDAYTGAVSLTEEERNNLLEQIEHWIAKTDASP